jgi:signal transduction histidine kinase
MAGCGTRAISQHHGRGSGIPKEDLAHVFDRFFRGDRSRNKRSGGLGLGLPIARDLVEIEGGHLDIKSTVGVGTRVTISYPRSVITRDESLLAS